MEVFVSWTGEDRDVKNVIVEKLHKENIKCWDSDEYCTSDYSLECIKAIENCAVFIVILSDASMQKGYVLNEVIKARSLENEGKLNILIYKITNSPLTQQFEFQLNHISFVSGNLIHRKQQQSESNIDHIIKRTKTLLRKRMEGEPEKPFAVSVPVVEGHSVTKIGYFVEDSRSEAINAIDLALSESNVIVINELFGFGKRSTIRKYIENHRNEYITVTMLTNHYDSLRKFFLLGLNFTNLNYKFFEDYEGDKLIDKKLEQLAKLDERTMLIIPDIKFERHLDLQLCEKLQSLKCRIVLITQQSAEQYKDIFPVVRLGRMSNEHLLELFYHHYPNIYDEEKEELNPYLEKFFDEMGGHTKTIELTATVLSCEMGAHPEEIPKYLSVNQQSGLELKDRIIEQISALYKIEQPGENETIALIAASLMAVPYISEQKFRELLKTFGITDWQIIKGLADKKWIDVDFKNRCVSVEPLIAQIVLKNNQKKLEVFAECLRYLYLSELKDINVVAAEYPILVNILNRLEHVLVSIGFEDMAQIPKNIKQYMASFDDESSDLLKKAIDVFENKYGIYVDSFIFDNDEDADADEQSYYDTEYEGEYDYSENDGDVYESDYFEDCKKTSISCEEIDVFDIDDLDPAKLSLTCMASVCVGMFLSMAKLFSHKYHNFFVSVSGLDGASKSYYNPTLDQLKFEDYMGISAKEIKAILEDLKNGSCADEENFEDRMYAETLLLLDSYTQSDFPAMMYHFDAILDVMIQMNDIDNNSESIKLFYNTIGAVAQSFAFSLQNYRVVINLCEKALAIKVDVPERALMVKAYIAALRNCGMYGDTLYSCYDEYISAFDKNLSKLIDKREDALAEKKNLYLDYAVDLIMGERFEEAVKSFALAQKQGKTLIADMTIDAGKRIMNAFINAGMFDEAMDFIKSHFDENITEKYAELCSDEGNEALKEILAVVHYSQNQDEGSDSADPLKYIDYYNDFSREYNSLSDKKYYRIADKVSSYDFSDLLDEEIAEYSVILAKKAKTMKMHDIAPEAFALVSEAGLRTLGYRHHYVQYVGAAAMADSKVAEMLNGEGKTYTIPLVAYLHYIYGQKVIVTDSSKYLSERNYKWMKGVYSLLGVDAMFMSDNRKDEIINSKGEICSVVYAYLNDAIFYYLRNEIMPLSQIKRLRMDCIIADEIDSVLVDCANQPYILSREEKDPFKRRELESAYQAALAMEYDEQYYSYKNNRIILKSNATSLIEKKFNISYTNFGDISQIKKIEQKVSNAVKWCFYCDENKEYFILDGVPLGEDKQKGVFYRFSTEITYFLCRKHGLDTKFFEDSLTNKSIQTNHICVRDFFKKFKTICGTTATAVSFKKEFKDIYGLDYVAIPPARPCKRNDYVSPVYINERVKRKAIVEKVVEKHRINQPVLLITQDIAESEMFSRILTRAGIKNTLLNAKNSDDCVDIIAQAGMPGSVMISTNIVNRGVDIVLGGNPQLNTRKDLVNMGVDVTGLDAILYSLPDENTMNSELYKKYNAVFEKNKAISAKNKEVIVSMGGLCVIGTGFFDEPGAEQQMRGRAGRQGEVGESWVFRSLDDPLLSLLVGESLLSVLKSTLDDDMTMSSRILDKSMRHARQKAHERKFEAIRHRNIASQYIDDARSEFIERRFRLKTSVDPIADFLLIWAKSKEIHRLIARLQRGEKVNESMVLNKLYSKHPSAIKSLRGSNLEKGLLPLLQTELENHFINEGFEGDGIAVKIIDYLLLKAWEEYINVVDDTYNSITINEKLLSKYLEDQKNIILLDMVEKIFNVRPKVPKTTHTHN